LHQFRLSIVPSKLPAGPASLERITKLSKAQWPLHGQNACDPKCRNEEVEDLFSNEHGRLNAW
jgi:hypothetical protein